MYSLPGKYNPPNPRLLTGIGDLPRSICLLVEWPGDDEEYSLAEEYLEEPKSCLDLDMGSLFASDKIADLCEFHPELDLWACPRWRSGNSVYAFTFLFQFPLIFPWLDLFNITLLMYKILYHPGSVLLKMTVGVQVISFVEVKMIWLNLGLWII
jgi:hypothetical protein